MAELLEFTPILRPDKDAIKTYYAENNIQIDDIPQFKEYIGTDYIEPTYTFTEEEKPQIPLKRKVSFGSKEKKAEPKTNNIIEEIKNLQIKDSDKDYLITMAKRESGFRPNITNQFGYYGLYQFGDLAFKDTGYSKKQFEKDTLAQHNAALKLANMNFKRLKPVADAYIGKEYKGVEITENGIKAAAHLLGAGTVKDWFMGTTKTKLARNGFKDGNGVHITEYFKLF